MYLKVKNLLCFLVILASAYSCKKEEEISPNQLQYRVFSGYGNVSSSMCVDISEDNHFVISLQIDNSNIILLKISGRGNLIWQKLIILDSDFSQNSIIASHNNQIFLVGESVNDTAPLSSDFVLVKLSGHGELEWEKRYGTPKNENIRYGIITRDNSLLLCGMQWGNACSHESIYIVNVGNDGDTLWAFAIPEPSFYGSYKVFQANDGSFIVYGYSWDVPEYRFLRLAKIDSNANLFWDRIVCTVEWYPISISEASSGDLMICGFYYSGNPIPIVCTNANGEMKWEKSYELWEAGSIGTNIFHYDDASFMIFSQKAVASSKNHKAEFGVIKIDEGGNELNKKIYASFDNAITIKGMNFDSYVFWHRRYSIYMTKIDQNGNPVMLDQW
ncbi:MAG: hypothetical protein KKD31_01865 [Bacteroidetes bacterium]|nr:hypothetical protein [Bacteroidota bacterium]